MSRTTLISALLGAALLAACKPEPEPKKSNGGDGEASVFEQFCNQLDECNSTMLEGMSATECADYFVDCTDDLLASEASDVESAMSECISEDDTCVDFEDCYLYDVPYC